MRVLWQKNGWKYVKQLLSDGINLLESCSSESLVKALNILQYQVHLDEDITIEIYTKQDEFINKRRPAIEDWLGNLKVGDILNATNAYKLLKENWLCPPIDVPARVMLQVVYINTLLIGTTDFIIHLKIVY